MEEFLEPLEISQNLLAVAIGVPPRRINEGRAFLTGIRSALAKRTPRLHRSCAGALQPRVTTTTALRSVPPCTWTQAP